MKELWVEKWRPKTVDSYVFRDETQKEKINGWIKSKEIPHILLSGSAGIGKTTIAKILINQLGVQDADVLIANGSKEARKIEWVDKLIMFCQTMPFGDFKVVLIDEADFMNPLSVQPALRNLMEEYSHSVRFILTCNYPNKILPAIHSRCQSMHIGKIDQTEYTARVAEILIAEGIQFDLDTLDTFVKVYYPDLRKCINTVQLNSQSGVLTSVTETDFSESDWKFELVELFKAGKIHEARKLLCGTVRPDEMEEVYRWLYDNVEIFKSSEQQLQAVLIIKQGMVDHTLVADPEINLAATLIRLARMCENTSE
jgi:DNA polymerase III delta prime subunit